MNDVTISRKEGWTFLEGRSLCGRWMLFADMEFEHGMDDHHKNCMACRRKREKEARSA